MTQEVHDRFFSVLPHTDLSECDIDEVYTSCKLACEMIGYTPNCLQKSFEEVWRTSNAENLPQFVYDVYTEDCLHDSK